MWAGALSAACICAHLACICALLLVLLVAVTAGNTFESLRSLAGWWRSSNSSLNFYRCPVRSQCLSTLPSGGSAVMVEFDTAPIDVSQRRLLDTTDNTGAVDTSDICGPPYFMCSTLCNNNRRAALCTQCLPGHREDLSGVRAHTYIRV
jgi:hypothetical protein